MGIIIAMLSAFLFAMFYPHLPGNNFKLKRVPLMFGLPALGVILGWVFGLSLLANLYLGLATFVGTGWMTVNIHPQNHSLVSTDRDRESKAHVAR